MLSYEHLEFLKENIVNYLPRPYIKIGDKYNFRCPFCGDSKKSATKKRGWVYSDQSFYCFNCGISLTGIKLLEALAGPVEFEDLKKKYLQLFFKSGLNGSLSAYYDLGQSKKDNLNIFNFKRELDPSLKLPLSKRARAYLENRLVLDAPFLQEPLFSTRDKDDCEYILIPWKINGIDAYWQLNDFQHLGSLKYIFPKDKKKLVYGIDNVDPTYKKIIVFEGVYDSLFVKNGVAVGTKAITSYQLKLIKQRWPTHEIVVSFDNDLAGISSMIKLICKDDIDLKFFRWFSKETKSKDINELVLECGNTNIFKDSSFLDSKIFGKLEMKTWLILNGLWKKEVANMTFKKANAKFSNAMNGGDLLKKRLELIRL